MVTRRTIFQVLRRKKDCTVCAKSISECTSTCNVQVHVYMYSAFCFSVGVI